MNRRGQVSCPARRPSQHQLTKTRAIDITITNTWSAVDNAPSCNHGPPSKLVPVGSEVVRAKMRLSPVSILC